MKLNIELTKETCVNIGGVFSPKENEDILNFKSRYDLSKAIIHLENGDTKKDFAFQQGFLIPDEFMFKGQLLIKVVLKVGNEVLKKWEFMPIGILQVPGGIKIVDFYTNLAEQVKQIQDYLSII